MRAVLFAIAIVLALCACDDSAPERAEGLHHRLGLRTGEDPQLRTTSGAGTTGNEDRPAPAAADPTTGTTTDPHGAEERHPSRSGTTGGLAPREHATPLPA